MSVRVPTTGPVAQAQRHRLDEVLRVGALVRRAVAPTSAAVEPAAWIGGQLVRLPEHPPPIPSPSGGPQLFLIDGHLYYWNDDSRWYERYYSEDDPPPPPPPPMRQPAGPLFDSDGRPFDERYAREEWGWRDEGPVPVPGRAPLVRDFAEDADNDENNNNYNNYNNYNYNNEDDVRDAMRRMDID